mgnify:CR=1 FL=1
MRKNGQKVLKNRMKKDSKATRIVTVICLCWAAFVALVPLVWLLLSSFKKIRWHARDLCFRNLSIWKDIFLLSVICM